MSVELESVSDQTGGLDLRTISFLHRVYVRVTPENHHSAISFLQKNFNGFTTYCDVTALTSAADIISLLDNGAVKVSASFDQIKAIVEHGLEDLGRLILSVDQAFYREDPESAAKELKDNLRTLCGASNIGIQVNGTAYGWNFLDVLQRQSPHSDDPNRYVLLTHDENPWDHYPRALKAGHVPIVPASALTVDENDHPELIPAHRLITSAIHSDRPDGLFPTVVSDEHGVCLGLVYSNEKSVETALKLGRGVYHSRSRNKTWIKGAESGDIQELLSIEWDCDADALRFTVRQKGDGKNKLSALIACITYGLQGFAI